MPRIIRIATLGLALLVSSTALAQPRARAAADALFKEGRAAYDRGDYARACPKFEESQRAEPAPGTLLNLALCEEHLGHLVAARQHIAEVLASLAPTDDRVPLAKDIAGKLEHRVAWLTLRLAPGAPGDIAIRDDRDGRTLGVGEAVVMDPGDHDLSVTVSGQPAAHFTFTLAEGQREERLVPIDAVAPSPDPAPVPPPPPLLPPLPPPIQPPVSRGINVRRTVGFAVGGLGVAGVVTAAVTGGLLLGKKGDVDAHCPNKRCDAEGLRLKTAAEKTPLLPVNMAAWVIGLAGVGAGVVLVATSSAGQTQSASIGVTTLPGGAGIAASGAF